MKKIISILILFFAGMTFISAQITTPYKVPRWVQNNNPDEPTVYSYDLWGGAQNVADSTEKADISLEKRAVGMIVTYYDSEWLTKRFEGVNTDDTAWHNESNWASIGGLVGQGGSSLPDSLSILVGNADSTWWKGVEIDTSGTFYWYHIEVSVAEIQAGDSIPLAFSKGTGYRITPITSIFSVYFAYNSNAYTAGGTSYIKTTGLSGAINRYSLAADIFTGTSDYFGTPHTNASAYFQDIHSNTMSGAITAGEVEWWLDLADFNTGNSTLYIAFPFTINKVE